jgi:hypothetical protein
MHRNLLSTLLVLAAISSPCAGQTGPRIVKMTVQPAGAPAQALRYALFPDLRDLQPGNAALGYSRAYSPEWYPNLTRHPEIAHFHEWLDMPLAKAPLDSAYSGVAIHMVRELDRAARMEACDWQMLPRMREEGFAMLIPDMQGFRTLGVLLALRCRYEMREHRLDKAAYSLQTGFAMTKHVGESPSLVTYLIGATIAHRMLVCVEELVQQPGASNLYWPLTDLPRPLIDLRRPLQGERVMVDAIFPEVRRAMQNPRSGPVPIQQLQVSLDKMAQFERRKEPIANAVAAATAYPQARQYLLDQGLPAEVVGTLPVMQVVLMHALAQYDAWTEDLHKLNNLPYWEAHPRLQKLQEQRQAAGKGSRHEPPFIAPLFFNSHRIFMMQARLQRWVDLLRCVEALRLHAADHGGALPASLDDIHMVPIPIDPITGKAFHYTREGTRAIVQAGPPPGDAENDYTAVRIEITLSASK